MIEIIETVYRSSGRVTVKYTAYLEPNELDSVWIGSIRLDCRLDCRLDQTKL